MSVNPMGLSPNPKTSPVVKGAATAPMIYFDNAPTLGLMSNIVEIDLAARVLVLQNDGSVSSDMVCIGHLRCGVDAALSLKVALERALDMAKAKGEPKPEDDYIDEDEISDKYGRIHAA
jgi:hypothetical protein